MLPVPKDKAMDTKQVIEALSALAQETRLAIYRLLMQRGPVGLPAGAIAEALNLPASSLSFHLAHLSRAGLVTQRREGRSLIYAVDVGGMNALMAYLTENCCGGNAACVPVCTPATCAPDSASATAATSKRRTSA
jgi:DNA-binding transcriptional ArsR family regulator